MRRMLLIVAVVMLAAFSWSTPPQRTAPPTVATYDALADAILAMKQAEAGLVRAMLDGHLRAASRRVERGEYAEAGAEMALFANEGDNAIGGIRKRLVEGGHHHHADGEAQGIYDEGFVVVTRRAKRALLESSAAMRVAKGEAKATAAWESFVAVARPLLETE